MCDSRLAFEGAAGAANLFAVQAHESEIRGAPLDSQQPLVRRAVVGPTQRMEVIGVVPLLPALFVVG